jgi:hypothetical protein
MILVSFLCVVYRVKKGLSKIKGKRIGGRDLRNGSLGCLSGALGRIAENDPDHDPLLMDDSREDRFFLAGRTQKGREVLSAPFSLVISPIACSWSKTLKLPSAS